MCDCADQCRAKPAGRPRPADRRDVFPCREHGYPAPFPAMACPECGHQDTQANP